MTTATAGGGPMRAIARNLGWMLASRGVLAVLSLVYLAIVTRTLGVSGFGRFALITGAGQALATIVGFQTWQIIVRYGTGPAGPAGPAGPNGHVGADGEARLARLFRACGLLDLGSACLGVILAAVVIYTWGEALGVRSVHTRATMIFTLAQLLSIRSTPLGILRLRDRFSIAAAADSVTPVMRLVGAVTAAVLLPSVTGFLIAWGLAEVLTAAAYWAALARTGDLRLLFARGVGVRDVVADHPGIVRFALATNASSSLGLSSKQIPLLLVGGTVGTASAGAFRLALQLALALTKVSQLLARAAFPEIVRAVAAGGLAQVRAMILRSFLMASVVAAFAFLIVVLFGHPILTLMGGKDFGPAYSILLWLAAAGCIDLVTAGFEPLLLAANRIGATFVARVVGIVALFAVAFWLSPLLEVIGVSIAVLVNALVVAGLLGFATYALVRREPVRPA
ncbi:lipopolysaccharide biosynthesis protein [Sphingomonas sp. RP10(2022)]|uniref:Lipopolysaccharide biosynthesis protein n=1 Tax=Sphingomonas liriopis TaxID=2949094 RepID=A0A9X2HQ18_9SPHN|nr:lipopolysaccharide biosynthesis protein [Sphingomonas liriopis]MCP3734372.1 lipopolysaccharide biosynthesis protein [Sphingomonas liriopis]